MLDCHLLERFWLFLLDVVDTEDRVDGIDLTRYKKRTDNDGLQIAQRPHETGRAPDATSGSLGGLVAASQLDQHGNPIPEMRSVAPN